MTIGKQHAKAREHRIGASETAAILGLSPWTTAYDVWLRLTGRLSEGDITGDQLEIGRMMEAPLLDWAAGKEGVKIIKNQVRVHASLPMSAQHDALIVGELRGMEAKTSGGGDAWGDPETDQVPDYYQVQAQHQMIVSGLSEILMPVALFGVSRRLVMYRCGANKDLQDLIIERVQAFFRLVETDTPPEASFPSPDYARRVMRHAGKRISLPTGAEQAAKAYQVAEQKRLELEGKAKEAKKEQDVAKAVLQGMLVDAEEGALTVDGKPFLFVAKRGHRKAYTVQETDTVKFELVEEKEG